MRISSLLMMAIPCVSSISVVGARGGWNLKWSWRSKSSSYRVGADRGAKRRAGREQNQALMGRYLSSTTDRLVVGSCARVRVFLGVKEFGIRDGHLLSLALFCTGQNARLSAQVGGRFEAETATAPDHPKLRRMASCQDYRGVSAPLHVCACAATTHLPLL
ncbi:hypothetical protein HRR83_006103 [Exophiala dermatitidis]|uniref:Secreted protein n=1 Tax=Exophiala dermatitidis TaxID=5970 RepID=A0AAN6ISL1_EXODE|nr:hypothetical protein HRR74_005500 [Exophiala dermatitidis]KAJ4517526.1 hypothetical protein HRR73_004578 [Exophiala dermatitidis]KAJ4548718.1 hypothetical protein HRR76_001301 [Exophiala dermatitidis]KAJ4552563.1 hypothetical protein HRR77_002569 [Exophiala dermatitidis]KAJ4567069.1 hypothetical protein HRR81_007145 [Exophiala dermatitidis]